ncbi:hypothetical protein [Trebonia sp.]|uniref:hypothetical protein n=1 Tax=Trebonia sp. TaxID=2767075 RepID=UPI00260DEFFA|nr:hypothetical protein [Trebonia sp.]
MAVRSKSSSMARACGSMMATVMSSPAKARIAAGDSQNVCAVSSTVPFPSRSRRRRYARSKPGSLRSWGSRVPVKYLP